MNPTHQKKKPNTVKVVLIMVFVIFLGISALLIWNAANARLAQKLTETFEEMREDGTMKEIVGTYMEDTDCYLEVRTDET